MPSSHGRTTNLCRREPCQSSCHRSGRRGARSPPTGSSPAGRCRPGCSHRLAGPSPPRQRWRSFGAACRSELEMEQKWQPVGACSHGWAFRGDEGKEELKKNKALKQNAWAWWESVVISEDIDRNFFQIWRWKCIVVCKTAKIARLYKLKGGIYILNLLYFSTKNQHSNQIRLRRLGLLRKPRRSNVMVDLQKVFIRVMCFTGRVADGHRRLTGLLTAVIGK